jgi:hypothetical protein
MLTQASVTRYLKVQLVTQDEQDKNTLRPGDFPMNQRNHRRTLFLANSFEACIAIGGFFGALLLILFPGVRDESAAGVIGFTFATQWAILYLIGSLAIIIGLWRAEDRFEIVGLLIFASATFVNAISLIQVKGFPSAGTYISFQYIGFTVGCLMRIFLLLRLRRVGVELGNRS